MIGIGLQKGNLDAVEEDLKEACPYDHMHGHPQDIHHDRNHQESTTHPHDSGKDPHEAAEDNRDQDRMGDPGFLKIRLKRESLKKSFKP